MSELPTLYAHQYTLDHTLDRFVPLSRNPSDGAIAYVPATRLSAAEAERDAAVQRAERAEADLAALRTERNGLRDLLREARDHLNEMHDCDDGDFLARIAAAIGGAS